MALINLALQGGGSHGAFTWGVLDALLEDGRIAFDGISGTSAGAMNAVALANGLAQAEGQSPDKEREAARKSLRGLWEGVIAMGALQSALPGLPRMLSNAVNNFWAQSVSPYQTNPLDINPLRQFLQLHIDFERLAASRSPKVFVVATKVSTGKAEVFSGKRLTPDAVMASACLPTLFQAVEIEGEHYWDGGFAGNPAIHPLFYECKSRDVLLVQINPIRRDKLPTTAADIMDRVNEITFNAALIAEMRAIDFVKRLLADGKLDPTRYKDVLLHRIDGGEALESYPASSKTQTDAKLIYTLYELGRECAAKWLHKHFDALGQHSTVNIATDYLDDLRVPSKARSKP
ncbi:patatin-like phospholipase family protein [Curvibacter sp. CHRR-16]|uniref:patatin-like phospholipase family protein n=1 Tax=Curvibacter sp. CHRR-16 TaxID=2835872 RepID=UPI001BDA4A2D|nr:patatin-like phospholipase family protein [Curvibacter sp. CHRR-16]MBT0569730.1 patatin-like phospholipase family protein [Curvibacter sp. CHRR-16]